METMKRVYMQTLLQTHIPNKYNTMGWYMAHTVRVSVWGGGRGLTCLLGVLQSGVPVVGVEAGLNPASHGPCAVHGLPRQVNVLSEEVIQHSCTRRAERRTSSTCIHEPQRRILLCTYMYIHICMSMEPLNSGHHWDPAGCPV